MSEVEEVARAFWKLFRSPSQTPITPPKPSEPEKAHTDGGQGPGVASLDVHES